MMSTNKKIYLVLILWIMFFGVLISFYLIPSIKDLREKSQRFVFQNKVQDLFKFKVEDFKKFQNTYSVYQPSLKKIEDSFIDSDAPIKFFKFLEQEAQSANVSIDIFPLSDIESTENDFWKASGFKLTIAGNFSDCLKFLERLERSSWLNEIMQVKIERIEERRAKEFGELKAGQVNCSLFVKVFSKDK